MSASSFNVFSEFYCLFSSYIIHVFLFLHFVATTATGWVVQYFQLVLGVYKGRKTEQKRRLVLGLSSVLHNPLPQLNLLNCYSKMNATSRIFFLLRDLLKLRAIFRINVKLNKINFLSIKRFILFLSKDFMLKLS